MKCLSILRAYAASTLIGLVLSYVLTIAAWNIVEPRMFHCTDGVPFALVVQDIDDHRLAGDTPLPGWDWGEIKTARLIWLGGFFLIWFTIAVLPRSVILSKASHEAVA